MINYFIYNQMQNKRIHLKSYKNLFKYKIFPRPGQILQKKKECNCYNTQEKGHLN